MKWKGQYIRGASFIPVKGIHLLHLAVIHTNYSQVKFLYSHYVSECFYIPAKPGAFNRNYLLEILQHKSHFKTNIPNIKGRIGMRLILTIKSTLKWLIINKHDLRKQDIDLHETKLLLSRTNS